jgi:hypothetical protein
MLEQDTEKTSFNAKHVWNPAPILGCISIHAAFIHRLEYVVYFEYVLAGASYTHIS